jgi:hypothetical protein
LRHTVQGSQGRDYFILFYFILFYGNFSPLKKFKIFISEIPDFYYFLIPKIKEWPKI